MGILINPAVPLWSDKHPTAVSWRIDESTERVRGCVSEAVEVNKPWQEAERALLHVSTGCVVWIHLRSVRIR